MRVYKQAYRDGRPSLRSVERDEALQNVNRDMADHLIGKHRVPRERVIGVLQTMDLRDKVMLEIEMRERQQELWQSDYEPFSKL